MRNEEHVEQWIASVLAGSGLPMSRRVEITEEWRGHLLELIHRYQQQGMDEDEAFRQAFHAFGDPNTLRRQLRRTQRMMDHGEALRGIKQKAWLFTLAPAGVVGLLAVIISGGKLFDGLVAGVAFLVVLSIPMALCGYVAARVRIAVLRQQPRNERHVVRRASLWTIIATTAIMCALVVSMFLIAICLPLFTKAESGLADANITTQLLQSFLRTTMESVAANGRQVVLEFFGLLVVGVTLAWMERSRALPPPSLALGEKLVS